MAVSIEEKVEDYYKKILDNIGLQRFSKTEPINFEIDGALKAANSKSGGNGNNYPDIKCLIDNKRGRRIPVMIECKGSKGKLEKLSKEGNIVGVTFKDGKPNYSAIQNFAVNGAVHYGLAIIENSNYNEVIVIGVNGTTLNTAGNVADPEFTAYYISKRNHRFPKLITKLDNNWSLLKPSVVDYLCTVLDDMSLTEEERAKIKENAEADLDSKIQEIHQSIYEDSRLKTQLGTNEKLYLFCGLIMAGLTVDGIAPLSSGDFKSNESESKNDGTEILDHINEFLKSKQCSDDKKEMITSLLSPIFKNKALWKPIKGESIIKELFLKIQQEIIPILESDLHLDFAGRILNKLSDWVNIENDSANDVVLTPRYITSFMARLAKTDMDSYVWDRAMGSAGFLVSAMDIMIRDAENRIHDPDELAEKIQNIKSKQLLGIEILGNIYVLAFLNMVLAGDGISNIIKADSHDRSEDDESRFKDGGDFPATVFLLNPPYSAKGKGFIFVEETLAQMTKGYACILIQENAGSGQGLPYTKNILKNNTLVASIHMPPDIFGGKASVQAGIYLFEVAKPHNEKKPVIFIDMSEDGYARQNRKKSDLRVNLRNVDHADERYAEVEAIVKGELLDGEAKYYTKENGKVIRDRITLSGEDWTFNQHKKIDTTPTEEDFKKTVADYLAWKVSAILKGQASADV